MEHLIKDVTYNNTNLEQVKYTIDINKLLE